MRYVICKEMGWDYWQFMQQPRHFIEEILIFMNQEGQKQRKDMPNMQKTKPITTRK